MFSSLAGISDGRLFHHDELYKPRETGWLWLFKQGGLAELVIMNETNIRHTTPDRENLLKWR